MFDAALLARDLKRDEAFRAVVYDDATGAAIGPGSTLKGHPTIGYGWALDLNGLTPERATTILGWHIADTRSELLRALPWIAQLDEPRARALANMAFNLGLPHLLGFKRMLAALQAKDWLSAAREARDSTWAHQVGARAERIAKTFETGIG